MNETQNKKAPVFSTVTIPVKPHIKKYITIRYGQEHQLTKKSLLGILIFNILDKKTPKPDQDFKDYKEKYVIKISQQYFNEYGFEIPLRKRRFLAICLERLFIEDFYAYVDIAISRTNQTAAESIRVFLAQYQISEDEIKLDSLYRQYQRHCKNGIRAKKII